MSNTRNLRVIITGVSDDGETCVIADRDASAFSAKTQALAAEFTHILGADHTVALPSDGRALTYGPGFFPVPGGFRFWLFTLPANSAAPLASSGTAYADTIEWVIVLDGEIEHVLPDGRSFLLKPGDSIVQIGAKHRWENNSNAPCRMAVAAVGAAAATPSPWMGMAADRTPD
jgi:hypothetical protein